MSLRALLLATRDRLRRQLSLAPSECEAYDDPQPPPTAGRRFLAVYPGPYGDGGHGDMSIFERIGVNVGITLRFSAVPKDRLASSVFLDALGGIEPLARAVMLACHRNYDLMQAANVIIADDLGLAVGDSTIQPFVEPLVWSGTGAKPEVKFGDWFWATDAAAAQKSALFVPVTFIGAKRPQTLCSTTR